MKIIKMSLHEIFLCIASLMLVFIFMSGFTSCNQTNTYDDYVPQGTAEYGPAPRDTHLGPDDFVSGSSNITCYSDFLWFYGLELSIYTVYPQSIATIAQAQSFMATHPGTTINVTTIRGRSDRELIEYDLITRLAAGTAPDMIHGQLLDRRAEAYLVDWFELVDAVPVVDIGFIRENILDTTSVDPYIPQWLRSLIVMQRFQDASILNNNVLEASAINGHLYTFPQYFNFNYVTANASIPGLAEAMGWYHQQYGGITMAQLLTLYNTIHAQSNMYFMYFDFDFDVYNAVFHSLHDFLDIGTRRIDFNNQQFIDFLNHSQNATRPEKTLGRNLLNRTVPASFNQMMVSTDKEYMLAESYFFQILPADIYQYFMDFQVEPPITGATPLITSQGELEITTSGFSLNASATRDQQLLAMQFMNYSIVNRSWRMFHRPNESVCNIPVNRGLLPYFFEGDRPIWALRSLYRTLPSGTSLDTVINDLVSQFEPILEMPMIVQWPHETDVIIKEVLEDFHYGRITAVQAAEELQYRVTVALE